MRFSQKELLFVSIFLPPLINYENYVIESSLKFLFSHKFSNNSLELY